MTPAERLIIQTARIDLWRRMRVLHAQGERPPIPVMPRTPAGPYRRRPTQTVREEPIPCHTGEH